MYTEEELNNYKNSILNMDCLDFLKECPDNYFDLACLDPPYGIGRFGDRVGKKANEWDFKPTQEYWNEIFRVSKNQIIFGGNYFTQFLPPTKAWIVWDKIGDYKLENNFSQCELVWTSFKSVTKKYTFVQQGFINDDKKENKFREHPTQKPLKLFQQILSDYSKEGELILDCFSGSGTTAIACHNLNRNFICIEKDYDYWKASVERLENAQAQCKLF